jgi:multidrug transporter EmrE-like cation transporter
MIHLFILPLLLTIRTYMYKLVTKDLISTEYLFLYAIMLMSITGYICYDKITTNSKIWNLSYLQYFIILVSALMSVYMATISFSILKNNTVIKSNYIIKGINLLMIVIVGKIFFKEELSYYNFCALSLIAIGIIMLSQ